MLLVNLNMQIHICELLLVNSSPLGRESMKCLAKEGAKVLLEEKRNIVFMSPERSESSVFHSCLGHRNVFMYN